MPNGTVKFFNAAKGFGFIAPEDGSPDVFVHVSALERSGVGGLGDGDLVSFDLERDRKSGKMAAVNIAVLGAGQPAQRRPAPGGFSHDRRDAPMGRSSAPRARSEGAVSGSGQGVVKWFNPAKGFGFILPSAGGEDIFVHISAVERAGLRELQEGQTVSYELEQDRRSGKVSAVNLRLD